MIQLWAAMREHGRDQSTAIEVALGSELAGERHVVCRGCGFHLAPQDARIEVQGQHDHRFPNPAGMIFHILCFERAPGCLAVGAPTREFSWFSGCAWRVAQCLSCATQVGWEFGGQIDFVALIADRIRVAPKGD